MARPQVGVLVCLALVGAACAPQHDARISPGSDDLETDADMSSASAGEDDTDGVAAPDDADEPERVADAGFDAAQPIFRDAAADGAAPVQSPHGTLLDVNDVTVLFPYDAAAEAMSPDVPLDAFMSREMFASVIAASKTVGIGHRNDQGSDIYENWKIVGFRMDPCAPGPEFVSGDIPAELRDEVPGCIVQLRLIAQPVAVRGPGAPTPPFGTDFPFGKKSPQDFGMHLIFDLGVFEGSPDTATLRARFAPFLPLVNGLQALKTLAREVTGVETNGALLGVHPALEQELAGPRREVAAAMATLLSSFAAADKLSLVTFMGIPDGTFAPWIFFSGKVRPNAAGVPEYRHDALPDFGASAKLAQRMPGVQRIIDFEDVPERPLSIARLFQQRNEDDGRNKAIAGAFEIENPALSHVLNMDCVSCHATHAPKGGAAQMGRLDSLAQLPASRHVPPRGVTGYLSEKAFNRFVWHVHNLGYFGVTPRISERTLEETSEVVDLVNRLIAGDGHVNPGLDCGTDRGALDALYLCQYQKRGEERTACFAACGQRVTVSM